MEMTQEELIDFLIGDAARQIEGVKSAIPGNYAWDGFQQVTLNTDSALRCHLERVALLHRGKKDKAAALAELSATVVLLDYTEDAIAKCNAIGRTAGNWLYVTNLTHAFLAVFLANDWQRALRLARAASLPVLRDEGPNAYDDIVRMLVATVLSDRDSFRDWRSRFVRDRGFYRYFRVYFSYDQLMDQIFEGNSDAFDAALAAHEKSFLKRANDKRIDRGPLLHACLDNNALVFDVWAVALANLARHKGLTIGHTSEIIPVRDFEVPA